MNPEVRFSGLLEAAPDPMIMVDARGRILLTNDEAERCFGYDRDELIGRPIEVLVPESVRARHPGLRERYVGHPTTRPMGADVALEGRRRDGSTFPAEISLSSVETEDGLVVFASIRDVAARRAAEDRFRGLLEAAPDAMVIADLDGTIAMVNGQVERLFDYTRAELIGQPVEILVPDQWREIHPSHRAAYSGAPATRPMGAGLELEGRRRDGTTFPAEISLSALDTEDGLLVSAAIRDVTERKAAELEAQLAREEAERANHAKSEFLSRMSHELRTPLNAILGFAQLMALEDVSDLQREHIDFVVKGGRHLLALVDEVLDISRIESGRLQIALEPVPLGEIVSETIDLVAPLAEERDVRFHIDPGVNTDLLVMADRQRFKQVVLNLASNAVKYNRPGGRVRVSWRQLDGHVRLEVADTGIGIRSDQLDRLFQPFERLDPQSTEAGTGLGLALSKGFIVTMHGRIGAESVHREGSTFWVELPRAEHASTRPGASRGHASAGADAADPVVPTTRILYVEDNLSNLRLVEHILAKRADVELVPTMQGSLALDLARRHRPDLVLLDLHLPDIPGEVVFERLRADPVTASIPIIIVSADAMPARIAELEAKGAFGYVTKPLELEVFLDVVDRAIKARRALGS